MRLVTTSLLLIIGVSFANANFLFDWLKDTLKTPEQDAEPTEEFTASSNTTCPCGLRNKQTRIVGGKETMANEYPFIMALYMGRSRTFFCGASILTERHAITAAHCTRGANGQTITAVAGVHNTRLGSPYAQEVRVASFVEHERYVQSAIFVINDIAILNLASPLRFNRYVSPVCMPVGRMDIENKMIKIIGWGKTGAYSPASSTLQEVDLQARSYDFCKSSYGISFMTEKSNPSMFCSSSPGKTPCMGDSGGPLLFLDPDTQRLTLVGLVSFGDGQCTGFKPAVATDVPHFIDWIRSKVRQPLCTKA